MNLRQSIDNETKKLVAEVTNTIPPGKRAALVLIADEGGARVHAAARLGDTWKVAFGAGKAWRGPVSGRVGLVGSW